MTEEEAIASGLESLLLEKKRQILQERLEILARYGVASIEELEAKIAEGEVPEHPAWEDLIVAENLAERAKEIDLDLQHAQQLGPDGHKGD
ncbi:MAG TPA: hypothetical protein EYP55_05930 [Anaerolineae bacterium]|nr:hypothetical protein [Anaerolineae bacterium]